MIFIIEKYLKENYASINKNEKLVILYWARQVGKTTLLKILLIDEELLWEKKYINFDDIYDKEFKNKDEFIKFLEFKNINTKYLNFENYEEFMFEKIEKYLEEYYLFWWYPAVILEKTKKGNVVKYIGAIDDNYKDAKAVNERYVEDAVDALLAGKEIKTKETRAIGCSIKV